MSLCHVSPLTYVHIMSHWHRQPSRIIFFTKQVDHFILYLGLPGDETRWEEIVINILELFAVPSLITVVITPVNLPAPLQPLYSCLCLVRKIFYFYLVNFLLTIISENIYCLVGRLNDMETWFWKEPGCDLWITISILILKDKRILFIVDLSCHSWGLSFFRRQDWRSSHWRRGISGNKKSISNHSHSWPQFDRSVSTIGGLGIICMKDQPSISNNCYLTDFRREENTTNQHKYLMDFFLLLTLTFCKPCVKLNNLQHDVSAKLLMDKITIISSHCVN